jgi:alpha-D-ribose 1-methylphosphonate 5-triphosphate diphosphatase
MWLTDVELVLADRVVERGALRIEAGRIAEVLERPVAGGVTGPGLTVFPGFVDMHGDMIELELEPRARVDFPMDVAIASLDARLAAAGVTTAYAAVSFSRGAADGERRSYEHTSRVIRRLHDLRRTCRVDHRIHARFDITFDNAVGVLDQLLDDGQVDLVSLMDHTPGQGQYRNIEAHIKAKAAEHGLLETEARQQVTTTIATRWRPQEVLMGNMTAVSRMCADHGVSLASHDDDTIEKARLMADLGAKIAEFPVTMQAARAAADRGLMTAMGAPNAMRGQSYSGNLSARDLHAAGLLHILASDYHPGAMLAAVRALADNDQAGLAGAVRLASCTPASALGLHDRGELSTGKRADLFVTDGNDRVVLTLCAGEIVHHNGTLDLTPAMAPAIA